MNQMKCSYSMSSLESPQKYLRTPEGNKKAVCISRLCNTLSSKKPRRTFDKKMWRRSWGSSEENSQDEVWKAYQKCFQEINEGRSDEPGLRDFLEDYSTVCEWLNSVQVERGRFADVEKLSELGAEMLKNQPWRVKINDTAKSLLKNYPKLKEEFQWRMKHLNSQWDALEKILLCQSATNFTDAILKNNGNEASGIEWLREWLKEMESNLQPLEFRTEWTAERLQHEVLRHKNLQSEIEKNSSKVHEALRQFGVGPAPRGTSKSTASGSKENTKRSRLETRWLQLRLRVLEWVQHLSGVQERLKYRNQGARSDNYTVTWESEGENNEPLSKYPRLGGNSDRDSKSPQGDHRQFGSPTGKKEKRISSRRSSLSSDWENKQFEVDKRLSITTSKISPPGKLLSRSGVSAFGVCANEVVDVMGQSHDSESVFNQSGSPVPNSVVEFIFDESHSVGMKRKLSPSSSPPPPPPLPSQLDEYQQQVVPRNISTYYFKHSDTESELNHHNRCCNESNVDGIVPTSPVDAEDLETFLKSCKNSSDIQLTDCKSGRNNNNKGFPFGIRRPRGKNWQKSRKVLDFGQKFEVGITSRKKSGDEISFDSELEELLVFDKEDEVMMDLEEELGLRDSPVHHDGIIMLDEIGELVQQAELLVKQSARSRGVECSVEVGSQSDDEDDENIIIKKQNGNGDQPNKNTIFAYSANSKSNRASREGLIGFPLRKCNNGSSISVLTNTSQIKCNKSSIWTTASGINTMDIGNNNALLRGDGESGSSVIASTTASGVQKTSKKSSRVRKWVRAHNSDSFQQIQKNTSSCDASAESTSDSESSSPESELPLSSDDPTTVSASTFLQQTQAALAECGTLRSRVKNLSSCSSSNNIDPLSLGVGALGLKHRSPQVSVSGSGGACGPVVFRTKKRAIFGKPRPKSFTEAFVGSTSNSQTAGSSTWLSSSQNCFVSDTALNLLGNRSASGSWSSSGSGSGGGGLSPGNSNSETRKKTNRVRRRLIKTKRKSFDDVRENETLGFVRSTSFTGATSDSFPISIEQSAACQSIVDNKENDCEIQHPKPQFQILGAVSQASVGRMNSDNGSMNTDGLNEQDWDSYQEKYLSETYSEEPYDPDGTLKLLAFGEDYGQYLERPDSESSSILSGFEPNNQRTRRPLVLANRGEMPESDSDREELNHLMSQSASQLRFIDAVFRKQFSASSNSDGGSPSEYAEMEATCDENIGSLKLVLSNIEKSDSLPFEVDVKSIEGVLEKWQILKERIKQAARLHQIREEMDDLKSDFSSVQSHFEDVDPFNANDLLSLQDKIGYIQEMLLELTQRKQKLQSLNEASLGSQLFLKDTGAVPIIKEQLQELYALYEENFQLGSYLLDKMRFLQDAWEKFETEKNEFERSINVGNLRSRLRKELSSAASTDSGHGTDSHDSSVSDSDLDFQERKQKLAALKKRACEIKSFLPPGSPVMDVIEQRVIEAEKGLEDLQRSTEVEKPLDLKIIYPKKRSPVPNRKSVSSLRGNRYNKQSTTPSSSPVKPTRKWKVVRRMVIFNFALMGLFLAAAYFLHPKCCEFTNTFCFSLVPHLTHESLPPI